MCDLPHLWKAWPIGSGNTKEGATVVLLPLLVVGSSVHLRRPGATHSSKLGAQGCPEGHHAE